MALYEFTEFFAVFVLHVDELDAIAIGADVANDRREMNLAEASADFEFDGVTDVEALRRFEVSAAETDGSYASEAGCALFDLRAQRRFERNTCIAARDDEVGAGLRGGFERS